MNGSWIGREPAAMMALSKLMVVGPFSPSTTGVSAGELARAVDHFHFTAFRHASQTAGQLSDDFSFQTRTLSMSVFGSPKTMPCSASALASSITLATCSSALEGIHPTFRQTRPEWNNVQPERFQDLSQRNERLQSNLPGRPKYHDLSFNFSTHHDLLIDCPAGQTSFYC